jgi:inhibitor of growth protein 5/inhibitor of growth protein 4
VCFKHIIDDEGTDWFVYPSLLHDTAIESLPLELQRNFTLLRELDGYAQGMKGRTCTRTHSHTHGTNFGLSFFIHSELLDSTAKEAIQLIDTIQDLTQEARLDRLQRFAVLLDESLKRGEEKVALAKSTFDSVERHCNRLDANLIKFEDEYNGWTDRITSLPGMAPSSRFLKDNVESKERALNHFRRQERKDKGEKRGNQQQQIDDE